MSSAKTETKTASSRQAEMDPREKDLQTAHEIHRIAQAIYGHIAMAGGGWGTPVCGPPLPMATPISPWAQPWANGAPGWQPW